MATIRSALNQYLASKTEITNLVGDRIFPVVRPQSSILPALGFKRLNGAHAHWITGGAGRAEPRFMLDCMAATYSDADALAEAVRGVMQGFTGTMPGGVQVTSTILDDEGDDADEPEDGSDRVVFHIPLIFKIQYRESIPTP